MRTKKGPRILIIIECTMCRINKNKIKNKISRYSTTKNRRNTIKKIELLKYCPYCNKHIIHKEIK